MNQSLKQMSNEFHINWIKKKKIIVKHILRIIFFQIIIIIGAYFKGFLTDVSWSIIAWSMIVVDILFTLYLMKKYYKYIFLSISFNGNNFKILYFKYGKRSKCELMPILVEVKKISVKYYSTISTIPVTIELISNDVTCRFRLLLKEMILLFSFIEKNGGTVKKDFDFRCSLKELLSNEEYKDVKGEIQQLLNS